MYATAKYIDRCVTVLIEEAETHGLAEVARLLKLASTEARELADLIQPVREGEHRPTDRLN